MKKFNKAQAELVDLCDKMENTLKLIRQRAEHYTSINSDPDLFVQSVTRITDNMLAECKATKILSAFTAQPDYKELGEYINKENERLMNLAVRRNGELAKALELCKEDLRAEYEARYPLKLREQYPSVQKGYDRDMSTVYNAEKALAEYTALVASGGGE